MNYLEGRTQELFNYLPPLTKKDDFDEFWEKTLEETRSVPLNVEMELYDYPSPYVQVYSVTYNGFDETRIHGWFIKPTFVKQDKLPCIIQYHGFKGNRGLPQSFMHWITMGTAVFSIDIRDQTGWTGNAAKYSCGSTQSAVCKGILNKEEYYFRAVYMDCVKAIDFVCTQEEIDQEKIIIHGGSQGGALGMAVCALDDRPSLAMVDVPSNSNITKRVEQGAGSFSAVTDYLKIFPQNTDQVLDTLSYFDTMNMADRIKCKVFASVGLKDLICPAQLYFATYNRIPGEKEIHIYPFNGHEGGQSLHMERKLRFLANHLKQ
ncbi:MAG: acetylxylan esterase [Epulopiscium sp.]|nr:acetylxylan esterase [Candidatus Epulonipiscium sp.]